MSLFAIPQKKIDTSETLDDSDDVRTFSIIITIGDPKAGMANYGPEAIWGPLTF